MHHDNHARVEILESEGDGEGISIRYGLHPSPFGDCFVATTGKGICTLSFPDGHRVGEAVEELRQRWPKATLVEDAETAAALAGRVFLPTRRKSDSPPAVTVKGTPFQLKVWEALVRIPPGRTVSYEEIACKVGHPKAVRAVGNAVACNPVAFLVPCHRVVRKSGALGNYRWGSALKQAILDWEATHSR